MSRITLLIKTNEGGTWVLPQVRELVSQGHTVTAVLPAGEGKLRRALEAESIPVMDSPFSFSFAPTWRLFIGLFRLRNTIRATNPDILFYHLYASALAARLASLGMKFRRVHMVAGPLYLESRSIKAVERLLCKLDDQLIAGSEYTASKYREIGMPEGRLSAIPYGVDVSAHLRLGDSRVSLFNVDKNTFVVVMVAYVYAPKNAVFPGVGIKGHDVILDVWESFCARHPQSLLVMVGSGFDADGERHRQQLLIDHKVAENPNVRWLTSVADVKPFYSSADLSVSPSLSENHGAALEASAMWLPSIVSDAGALPETVTPESGWVVKAGDRDDLLDALWQAHQKFAEKLLTPMGKAARRHVVKYFSHATVVPRVVEAVVGEARVPGSVLAFTEQRTWLSTDGNVWGLRSLAIVESLAQVCTVSIGARGGAPAAAAGVPLSPSATSLVIPWPTGHLTSIYILARSFGRIWKSVGRADVVYADQPGIVGSFGVSVAWLRRKPFVVNVVGDSNESVSRLVFPGMKGRVAHAVFPRLQRWACAHATYANYVTKHVLQEHYPCPRAKETFFATTAVTLGPARPRNFPEGTVSLVTVASLEQPYKGIGDLLKAVSICRSQGLDVRLTVVGAGRLRDGFSADAERLGLDVQFTGHLYGDDLYVELGKHDGFVLASWTEGLPRALVEAMADGLPAIATRVGGVPELLEQHRTMPPHCPEELARCIHVLFESEQSWLKSIDLNFEVARQRIAMSKPQVSAFVAAIKNLSST